MIKDFIIIYLALALFLTADVFVLPEKEAFSFNSIVQSAVYVVAWPIFWLLAIIEASK